MSRRLISTYNDWYSKFRTQPAAVSILDIFVEYGNEVSIVLLQAYLDQVKFQSEDFQSKPDLLSAIYRYFLGRPNFATVFCEALRSKVMSEGFLEGLSKQLHLSTPEKIAVGLALSHSGNTDFRIRAITTAIAIAEILKKKGRAIEKRILMSTVDTKDESKGRLIPKAKIEVLLEKTEKFDDLMVVVAAKGRQLETIKHDGKP